METCNGVNAIFVLVVGLLFFQVSIVYMLGVVRDEVRQLGRKWKEVME